ncbi:gephyrin-like molybdotransferase Glp [Roseateles sp. BYS180W]|uniref:Molybdopterin molybdenumtransferase n=1 Tax=Roseateles rivi TaxID=3299028 RepID=A0ABW7FSM1_9BURK
MKPAQPLMSLDDALQHMLQKVQPLADVETLPLAQALGRVLRQPLHARIDVPPQDNSAMDGYALSLADWPQPWPEAGVVLPVSQRVAAGHLPQPLQPGTAARIFTGAFVPPGADAVLMQEQTEVLQPGVPGQVRLLAAPTPGQAIRRRGEDLRADHEVLSAGLRLQAGALGLAAAAGHASVTVSRRPRVALFSTGDELMQPGDAPRPGAIYNSNRTLLQALLQDWGCEVLDLGMVPDQLDATRAALRTAAAQADLVLTTGGVSVGEEDHIKAAVQAEGALQLWQIAMKPGKPLAFGQVGPAQQPVWFVGLPGNPVSSWVTCLLTVRPLLLRLQGASELQPQALQLPAAFAWPRPDKRREFLRARLNDQGALELFRNQGSGVLSSAVWADGLVDVAAGQTIEPGQPVRFLPLSQLR